MKETGYVNVREMFRQADEIDLYEGRLAYSRYREMMARFAAEYSHDIREVTAAFVALSPNNDYLGNLRSLKTLLEADRQGIPVEHASVSTYIACRTRAWKYLQKADDFLLTARGPKTRAFYHNILWPNNPDYVTIDGHMVAIFMNNEGTMKENIIKNETMYNRVAAAVKRCARINSMLPNQMQATLWYTRKRLLRVKFEAQFQLFGDPTDRWGASMDINEIKPYEFKAKKKSEVALAKERIDQEQEKMHELRQQRGEAEWHRESAL
jgi:hypothetical protein